jgi:sulfur-oxidizing protein SoxA
MKSRLFVAALLALPCAAAAEDRRSGFDFMGPDTQAMQRDDAANPGMLAVLDGAALWDAAPAPGTKSCADCHGAAETSMRGVAARYPAWDAAAARPIDLQGRVEQCRVARQNQPPFGFETAELLGLTAFLGAQSRGVPLAPSPDPRLTPFRAAGRALYETRIGQLDLACVACHDANAGGRLGSSPITQGHATGYPLYRLEWQAIGSLQRRLRNCMTGVRAEPFAFGAPELVELELYLASRAAPLTVETPAVRP